MFIAVTERIQNTLLHMKIDLTQIKTINDLVKTKSTGRPKELAKRLGISERSLSDIIRYMREELDTPIEYDRIRGTYFYMEDGNITIKFQRDKDMARKIINFLQTSIGIMVNISLLIEPMF